LTGETRIPAGRPFALGNMDLGGPHVAICVPLVARNGMELLASAKRVAVLEPDCVELRCDYLDDADLTPDRVAQILDDLVTVLRLPIIVTNRHHSEGGASQQPESSRLAILTAAAATGFPAMVDLEMSVQGDAAQLVISTARTAGVRLIRSWHNFGHTPSSEELSARLRAAQDAGADLAKIAVMPIEPDDVLRLLEVGLAARRDFLQIPTALMAMGTLGGITRLGGGFFGSDLTFAMGDSPSAPGQMPIETVRRGLVALGLSGGNARARAD